VAAIAAGAGAAALATTTDGTERAGGSASAEPPRLCRVSTQAFLVAPLRFLLSLIGLGAALALGLTPGVGLLAFAFGAVLLFVSALADPRRRLLARGLEPVPVPPDARYASRAELAWSGLLPSSLAVSGLAVVALGFNKTLAVLLAGAVAGMGLAGLVGGARIAEEERREGVALYVERGGQGRAFSRATGEGELGAP
jgi:hypothetical protein